MIQVADDSISRESAAVPRRVWRATGLLAGGRVWGTLCTFVVLALLARYLSGADFGRFTFYLAVFTLLESLTDFGTSAATMQRGAHDPYALTAGLIAGRRIRTAAAGLGFILVLTAAFVFEEQGLAWVVLASLLLFTRVLELSGVVFQRKIAWGVPVGTRAGAAALRLGFVVALWAAGVRSFGPYVLAHVGGNAIANVTLHVLARPHLPRPTIPIASDAGLLRAALPLAVAAVCQQGYFYVDNLFVRGFRGDVELGHYNAAVRILSFAILIAVFATNAALPWLARRRHAGDLKRATLRLVVPLLATGALLLAVLWPFSADLLRVIFGPDFAVAGPSLRWLLVATAIIYAGSGLLTAVVAAGRGAAVLWIAAAGLALNALANLWLVPERGMEGAAIATVATELFVAVAALVVLLRE